MVALNSVQTILAYCSIGSILSWICFLLFAKTVPRCSLSLDAVMGSSSLRDTAAATTTTCLIQRLTSAVPGIHTHGVNMAVAQAIHSGWTIRSAVEGKSCRMPWETRAAREGTPRQAFLFSTTPTGVVGTRCEPAIPTDMAWDIWAYPARRAKFEQIARQSSRQQSIYVTYAQRLKQQTPATRV